jgi:hypothetical protein
MYGVFLLYLLVHYIGFCGYEGRRGRIYEERSDGVWNERSSVDAFLSQVLSPNISAHNADIPKEVEKKSLNLLANSLPDIK